MNKKMREMDKDLREAQFEDEMHIQKAASKARFTRARSFSVGCMSCGAVEIMMRGDEAYLWYVMSPDDVINTVHQLASSVGLTAHLTKKSWLGNHATTQLIETHLTPSKDEQKLLGHNNGETLAIEAPKQRRKSKRAAASS